MKAIQCFSWSSAFIVLLFITTFCSRPNAQVSFRAEIEGCGSVMNIYTFNGFQFETVATDHSEEARFEFEIPASEPQFYYVGPSERKVVPIILGQEEEVQVKGICDQLRQLEFVSGGINADYAQLKDRIEKFNQRNSSLIRALQRARTDQERHAVLLEDLKVLDDERMAFLEETRESQPLFGDIVALNTYLSYPHHGQEYDNEVGYYADNYFRFADLKSPGYATLPWTYESFSSYAGTLSSVGLPDDIHKLYIEKSLDLAPAASTTQKLAFGGVLSALKQKKHANYAYFADLFIERFQKTDPSTTAAFQKELAQTRSLMVGGTAPDFTQETPKGEDLSLSELRGKVVLIDFWASWCGPCRRENPNVVRVYEKYQDKGFEIIGVSLDRDRSRWLQAIEKDGLKWHHVSDLQGWQNAVAQTYGVTSIPHTILLDAEGKILARNLRGRQLEEKLAELFE